MATLYRCDVVVALGCDVATTASLGHARVQAHSGEIPRFSAQLGEDG